MDECGVLRENMPLLLTESLDTAARETTHQHIEHCALCMREWNSLREAWTFLGELPEVEPPAGIKQKFLSEISPAQARPADNVVPFTKRPAFRWIAQAAAVVIIAGGSYFAGNRNGTVTVTPTSVTAMNRSEIRPISTNATPYSIAESRVLPANLINPNIEGRPDIQNLQLSDPNPNDGEIGVSFDITSHVTVTGKPTDKSLVRLLAYAVVNEDKMSPSRSRAIDLIKATYTSPDVADPEIREALATVLRNDEHQGVRIKAVDTLKAMPVNSGDEKTTQALIEALKNDPNPAVRLKAVEALVVLAKSGAQLDPSTLETLRAKAVQDDENKYVRVKAAEALSNAQP